MLLASTFESVIMSHLFPKSEIDIHVQILQADGGTLPAAVNATSLALLDAGIPIRDFVVACSCSCLNGVPVADANHQEDLAGGVNMMVAMLPRSGKVATMQTDSVLPLDMLNPTLKMASEGCNKMYEIMQSEVREHTVHLLEAKGTTLTN
eukprot:TRINITY_DN23392_c0_g1_i2.p2 TRINITY_DN23392_c0_g1~~TRINITY_DN23392_c0_g1_i2.p2  ORF type:complete len:150 (-),score=50.87 TRINITY_DN23392_c0_g1_i2:82-531(-)